MGELVSRVGTLYAHSALPTTATKSSIPMRKKFAKFVGERVDHFVTTLATPGDTNPYNPESSEPYRPHDSGNANIPDLSSPYHPHNSFGPEPYNPESLQPHHTQDSFAPTSANPAVGVGYPYSAPYPIPHYPAVSDTNSSAPCAPSAHFAVGSSNPYGAQPHPPPNPDHVTANPANVYTNRPYNPSHPVQCPPPPNAQQQHALGSSGAAGGQFSTLAHPTWDTTPAAPTGAGNVNPYAATQAATSNSAPDKPIPPRPAPNQNTMPAAPGAGVASNGNVGRGRLLSKELLLQVNTRPHSARTTLGDVAVLEARKGLSRVLHPGDDADLERFAVQLRNQDAAASEENYEAMNDKVLCFALSYVHTTQPVGRFKFTPEQWGNFKVACVEIFACGVREMRVWLDQCLWLRDASQGAWAHTGLMPYVMWPVISLGTKGLGDERTRETYERMWPFVEEIAGLWSMGVIITREMRGKTMEAGCRRWLSFQLRHRLEPEDSMRLILLNIFHGAVDHLQTGWTDDVNELKEMARWNFTGHRNEHVIVGSDWKARIARFQPKTTPEVISSMALSIWNRFFGGLNAYLDGSRRLMNNNKWDGMKEWMSGNEGAVPRGLHDKYYVEIGMEKFNVITDRGEYQMLRIGTVKSAIWLLVAMDGRSSNFSRGHVAWTKIMHGAAHCRLQDAFKVKNQLVIEGVLQEQLGGSVRILSMRSVSAPMEWT